MVQPPARDDAAWLHLSQPHIGRAVALLRRALGRAGRELPRQAFADRLADMATDYSAVDARLVQRWESGATSPSPHYRRLLARLAERDLGGVNAVERRAFLGALAALAAAGAAPGWLDVERLLAPGRVDARKLDDLAALTRLYARQGHEIGPGPLLPAMRDHLARLNSLLRSAQPDATARRLLGITSEASLVAGRLAFWRDDRGTAADWFREAATLGEEAGEGWLRAAAFVHEADLHSGVPFLGTQGGSTLRALALIDSAAALDAPDWSPLLRAWVYGCRAEEMAALGRRAEADHDMALADRALALAACGHEVPVIDIGASPGALTGFRGAVAIGLGRAEDALAAFGAGLDEASSVGRLSGAAAGYALMGEPERAAELLGLALEASTRAGLTTRRRRVEGVRLRYLEPWANLSAVQELDDRFRELAR